MYGNRNYGGGYGTNMPGVQWGGGGGRWGGGGSPPGYIGPPETVGGYGKDIFGMPGGRPGPDTLPPGGGYFGMPGGQPGPATLPPGGRADGGRGRPGAAGLPSGGPSGGEDADAYWRNLGAFSANPPMFSTNMPGVGGGVNYNAPVMPPGLGGGMRGGGMGPGGVGPAGMRGGGMRGGGYGNMPGIPWGGGGLASLLGNYMGGQTNMPGIPWGGGYGNMPGIQWGGGMRGGGWNR